MPKGSGLCGAVRFETAKALEGIDHCHCSRCRKAHGAAFATFGRVEKDALDIATGAAQVKRFASSEDVTRSFCSECGSNLFFEHAAAPPYVFVAIGSLDEDPGNRPQAHIFAGSKADWDVILDDLPQHEAYPPGVAD
jgi:hypothetical protein